jgi:hypothetical protein
MEEPGNHGDALPRPLPTEFRPSHGEDGVDLTLIRWMLSLTPGERLEMLQNTVRSILRLRDVQSKS